MRTQPLLLPPHQPWLPGVLSQTGCGAQSPKGSAFAGDRALSAAPKTLVALQTLHSLPSLSASSGRSLLLTCGLPRTHTHGHTIHEVKLIVSRSLFPDAGVCPLGSNSIVGSTSRMFLRSVIPLPQQHWAPTSTSPAGEELTRRQTPLSCAQCAAFRQEGAGLMGERVFGSPFCGLFPSGTRVDSAGTSLS